MTMNYDTNVPIEIATTIGSVDLSQFNETERRVIITMHESAQRCDGMTYAQIAESVGISTRHLMRIRQKPAVQMALKRCTFETCDEILTQAMPGIVHAMIKQAHNGNAKSQQLAMQAYGLLIDRKEIVATTAASVGDYSGLTNNERQSRIDEIHRKLNAQPSRIEVGGN